VEPYYSFNVSDVRYLFTFAVMLGIGLLISELTAQVRERLRASQRQEHRTAALYRLTRQLSEVAGTEFLIRTAGRQLGEIFGAEVVLFVREGNAPLAVRFGEDTSVAREPINAVVAQWVTDHDQTAGAGTDTLPNATALFVPLVGSQRTIGALGIRPNDAQALADPEQRRLLETCASLIALSVERDQSLLEANRALVQVQAEQLRSSLLSSVSHDLRTPLAAIAGAGTSLLDATGDQNANVRRELLQGIVDESRRLSRLVDNLLDMTRLTSGPIVLNRQWHVLEEIIGTALNRLRRELERHTVVVDLPADLPLLSLDGVLLEQVFVNLLENAAHYTSPGSRIELHARRVGDRVEIVVADDGPGLPAGSEERVFEKFYRAASTPDGRRGVGLGLAICKAIVEAHGGRITARNRPSGGAEFIIALPCLEDAPQVALDEVSAGSNA
jgi:two-component system sensor histidine kinase KdpD